MARSRSSLKPDLSPFLAVLLCTMGSLIVVLLILDRQARILAKQRAVAKAKAIEQKQHQQAAKHQAQIKAKAEQHRKQVQALREKQNKLRAELKQLQTQYRKLQQQRTTYDSARDATLNQVAHTSQSINKTLKQLATLDKKKAKLASEVTRIQRQIEQQQQQLKEMQKVSDVVEQQSRIRSEVELLIKQLDKALTEKKKQKKTWSIIPYHGTRGANKVPIYVECAKEGLIFYPDQKKITDTLNGVLKIRQEIIARQKSYGNAYWLLLVRPDGILGYYQFQTALKDLDILFGYELIDAEWELNLPLASALPSGRGRVGVGSTASSKSPPQRKGNPKRGSSRQPLKPGYRLGDRDWELIVECTATQVRLRPSSLTIKVDDLLPGKSGAEKLYVTAKRLIERQRIKLRVRKSKQVPQIKFMVHRNALRTYHLTYPILNSLPVLKTATIKEE